MVWDLQDHAVELSFRIIAWRRWCCSWRVCVLLDHKIDATEYKRPSPHIMDTLPQTTPTICIPHIHSSITEADVQKAFVSFGIGKVTYIRILARTGYSCAFVHLVWDTQTEKARKIRRRLLKGKAVRYLYGDDLEQTPWFWKCVAVKQHILKDIP